MPISPPSSALSDLLAGPLDLADAEARAVAELERRAKAWRRIARPSQLAPGSPGAENPRSDWTFWMLCAGRGFGKTKAGAEWVIEKAREHPGAHIALVAATADDARKTMLSSGLEGVPGMSGILAVSPSDFRPIYEPSKRTVTWSNGSVATLYSAEEPDRLRGPQHTHCWVDEIAAWTGEQAAWDQIRFGLRLGQHPQAVITTTPRPIKIVRDLLTDPLCVTTRGRSSDNAANLAPALFSSLLSKYEGTRLGRQELDGEVLEDVQGALWSGDAIDRLRVQLHPALRRIVVAIDPAVSNHDGSDETGIIVAGIGECPCKGAGKEELHGFVLADLSGKHSPDEWGRAAIGAYRDFKADRIIAEVNNGGALVEANLRTIDRNAAYKAVHAVQGKRTRAEPIAALTEQGKIHHVGAFPKLEEQLTTWAALSGQQSPDRLDALVWALSELMLVGQESVAAIWARGIK